MTDPLPTPPASAPPPAVGAMLVRELPPEDLTAVAHDLAAHVDELWVVEDCFYAGGVAQAAAVLEAVPDVVVGHGIAPAPFRNPAALAMEWATLARRHPGRLIGGVGHGVGEWMDQIGARPTSPLALLDETITAVRALLRGERVDVDGRYVRLRDVELRFPPPALPPVLAGVRRPRSLQLAGRVADGVILAEWTSPAGVRAALDHVRAGRAAGGPSGPPEVVVFCAFRLDDERAAADVLRPVAEESLRWPDPPLACWPDGPPTGADAEALLRDGAAVGGPDTVRQRIDELAAAGAHHSVFTPWGPDPADQLARLAATVLAHRR